MAQGLKSYNEHFESILPLMVTDVRTIPDWQLYATYGLLHRSNFNIAWNELFDYLVCAAESRAAE
jgi:hypothetical protein